MVAPFGAALADASAGRGEQPQVPVVRIKHAITWLRAFCLELPAPMLRCFPVAQRACNEVIQLAFDASPWGYGGVMLVNGCPKEFFAEDISELGEEILESKVGDCRGQARFEGMAVLIGLRLWLPAWRSKPVVVVTRTDSMAALGSYSAGRSTHRVMNLLVREYALDAAQGLYEPTFVKHVRGVDNKLADALSRLNAPGSTGSTPAALMDAARLLVPPRSRGWWRTLGAPRAG